jgi:hypothetical protein
MAGILDLDRNSFFGAMDELGIVGEQRDDLVRQYREKSSPVGLLMQAGETDPGMVRSDIMPFVRPEGMSLWDAWKSGDAEFAVPGFLTGAVSGSARAFDAPGAAGLGLIPEQDMAGEALGVAGAAQLGGGAVTRPMGSLGMGGRVAAPDIDARVAAARQAVLDSPNDAALFDQYKAIRRERDAMGSRALDVELARAPTADQGFEAYLSRVNPAAARIADTERPNLGMGDMYGMLPRNAQKVGERDGVTFYRGRDGATYAVAFNPDVGEMDVVGYAMPGGNMTDLAVVNEMQGRGIGSELQYLMRSQDPYALTGGLTEAGERTLRGTYNRLRDEGIVSANRDETAGLLAMAAAAEPRNAAEQMARGILDMRAAGRAGEVTDEMMAQADPQYMFYNTPLPMDEASRMARAREAGFDVNDEMYRGDATRSAFQTGQGQRDQIGVTMSSRPDVAASYIPSRGEGGIYPLFSRGNNDAVIGAEGRNWNVIDRDAMVDFQGDISALRDYVPDSAFEKYDVLAGTDFLSTNDLSRLFQGYGADRVRFNDLVDRGSSARYYGPESSMPSDVAMVANPANVRSRFARFDPEFAHLSNLSAANVDPLVGLLGVLAAEEQRRQRNSQ